MLNSILFFKQFCIKYFEKPEDEFLNNPINVAEYVFWLTELLCKFSSEIIRDSLETTLCYVRALSSEIEIRAFLLAEQIIYGASKHPQYAECGVFRDQSEFCFR